MEEQSLHNQNNTMSTSGEKENTNVGKENIGRWNQTEHDLFLKGLEKYGKDWKAIAADIPTRSVVQVRTHAQKYFQKISQNPRPSQSMSRKRSIDGKMVHKTDEPEKVENAETSTTTSPSSEATLPTDDYELKRPTTNPSVQLTNGQPDISVPGMQGMSSMSGMSSISNISSMQGMSGMSGMSGISSVPSYIGMTPRSPVSDLVFNDSEMFNSGPLQQGIYNFYSPFEQECNNNQDDMREIAADDST